MTNRQGVALLLHGTMTAERECLLKLYGWFLRSSGKLFDALEDQAYEALYWDVDAASEGIKEE